MFVFSEKDFLKVAAEGKITPLIFEKEAGEETPVSAYLKLGGGKNSFLLESAGGSPSLTEYSFVGTDPFKVVQTRGSNPLSLLRSMINAFSLGEVKTPFPFWGGAVGYLSYDIARYLEKLPVLARDDLKLPESVFIFPQILLVFDHKKNKLFVIVNQLVGSNPRKAFEEAQAKLNSILILLDSRGFPASAGAGLESPTYPRVVSKVDRRIAKLDSRDFLVSANLSQAQFESIVRRAKKYIYAGDIFQSNLSVRFDLPFEGDPFSLYLTLREINPSPFAAYFNFGHFHLVSSSPERLIMLRDGIAETRPIAGTRRRGKDYHEDKGLSADLILDEKERAEHIMLVDLERNDLGRVCEYGTVLPSELFTIEKYSHVIHIVSNIKGELTEGKDQFDLIRAMFPGGTITGCPKVRCMEIIEELEPTRRGPYTGSIGYFGFNGNMDMNIAIRTFVIRDGRAFVQAGSGIVADSDPSREYFEAVSKANALLKALGVEEEKIKWEKLPM